MGVSNGWEVDSDSLYNTLENDILPTYLNHDEWLFKSKNAIALAAFFNTNRMMKEYASKAYKLKRQKPWKFIT